MPIEGDRILAGGGGLEPLRMNNWILQFSGGNEIGLSHEEFYLALESFPFPAERSSRQTVRWWNESRHYAGSMEDFSVANLRIRDYIDLDNAKYLQDWRRRVHNMQNGAVGHANQYKLNGSLFFMSSTTPSIQEGMADSRKVVIQGAFPLSFDMGEFSMGNNGEQVMVTCEISIDKAYAADKNNGYSTDGLGRRALNRNAP